MLVPAIALTSFVHDDIRGVKDGPLDLDEHLAADLERAGLIRIRQMVRRVDRNLVAMPGAEILPVKIDAGRAIPSSSLPAAPVSSLTGTRTLHLPKRGSGKIRSGGTL